MAAMVGGAMVWPSTPIARGANANGKLQIAIVGVGGQGGVHVGGCGREDIVALCDVDSARAAKGFEQVPAARRFSDYRVMLEEMGEKIDAVAISTPDHTHFSIALACMQAGKHVLVEKPLTHTVWEARTLREAAHRYGVVTQMGNQGHATEHIRLGVECFEAGVLGQVRHVEAWNSGPTERWFGNPQSDPPPTEPQPSSLNWDVWLGPRAERPFSSAYHPQTWRGWFDFGNGPLGDWSAHTLDLPFWALRLDAPMSVYAETAERHLAGYIPAWSVVTWEFRARGDLPPVTVRWHDGGKRPPLPVGKEEIDGSGMYMVGERATLMTGGRPNTGLHITEPDKDEQWRQNRPAQTLPRIQGDHFAEWIGAIKGAGPAPGSNFDYAVPPALRPIGFRSSSVTRDAEGSAGQFIAPNAGSRLSISNFADRLLIQPPRTGPARRRGKSALPVDGGRTTWYTSATQRIILSLVQGDLARAPSRRHQKDNDHWLRPYRDRPGL